MMLIDNQIELKSSAKILETLWRIYFGRNKDDDPRICQMDIFRKDIVEIVSSTQKSYSRVISRNKILAMTSALNDLNDGEMENLYKIAVFHYMFGYIHPFYDGNGRMTRFISSYLLAQRLEPVVAFGLSYTIKEK